MCVCGHVLRLSGLTCVAGGVSEASVTGSEAGPSGVRVRVRVGSRTGDDPHSRGSIFSPLSSCSMGHSSLSESPKTHIKFHFDFCYETGSRFWPSLTGVAAGIPGQMGQGRLWARVSAQRVTVLGLNVRRHWRCRGQILLSVHSISMAGQERVA